MSSLLILAICVMFFFFFFPSMFAFKGNLIRDMKSRGVERSEWMPHVSVLKDMKKQYEDLKKAIGGNFVTNGKS